MCHVPGERGKAIPREIHTTNDQRFSVSALADRSRRHDLVSMSEHHATLSWSRGESGFGYKDYSRTHVWTFPRSGQSVQAAAAPAFLGKDDCVDPEEAFAAALASCHLLTFLAIASMSGYVVDQYDDAPVGYLEKGENGRLWLARVVMHPKIVFSGEKQPSPEDLARLHEKAHHECFLANSVKTEVTWD
jgi:organic hydroperoxide reductase OsmC/OhrA